MRAIFLFAFEYPFTLIYFWNYNLEVPGEFTREGSMASRAVPKNLDSTDQILSELGHVIDEAEIVKYIVQISDRVHQLKLDNAPSYKIEFLSHQLSLLENKLANLRLIRKQKFNL